MLPGREARTHSNNPLTWIQLLEIGLGELMLEPEVLYEFSMEEFVIAVEGSRKRDIEQWRHTRALGYMMVLPYLKKKVSQEQFMPLPGDKSYDKKRRKRIADMTKEERIKTFGDILAQMKDEGIITDN